MWSEWGFSLFNYEVLDMIKVTELKNTDTDFNSYKISAFADSKDDVTPNMKIIGLPKNAKIEMGSSILTADGELAFLKSNGTWNWV